MLLMNQNQISMLACLEALMEIQQIFPIFLIFLLPLNYLLLQIFPLLIQLSAFFVKI